MKRVVIAFAALIYLGILGCMTHPKPKPAPPLVTRKPSEVPFAIIGIQECGEFQGFVVVTADGKITVIPDDDGGDMVGLAKLVPEGSIGTVGTGQFCPPRIKT